MSEQKSYEIVDFSQITPVPCPCGMSKRAFIEGSGGRASFHVVEIKKDSEVHYHKKQIEIYYILEGEGYMELDEEKIPVHPGSSILIRENCRHRAVGKLKLINVPVPAFDPEDEWFD
ncbi:MAG: cupin domain-containing protein [Clostridiaceae bacterium]|nr:cupin domain-containing protein [Clostridiaceae bacterium]